jgi:alginate O-acetyltransferase complex protein AlgI
MGSAISRAGRSPGDFLVLFNSYQFIFLFFPVALALYYLAGFVGEHARITTLLVMSFVFYGAWDVRFLMLLVVSILVNFTFGRLLEKAVFKDQHGKSNLLISAGVASNLLVLGFFKYGHFAVENFNATTGTNFVFAAIILPLGISFFTFEQIGYLADIRRGHFYRADLLRYAVFVSFFPRLVAGPILRYGEIAPQLILKEESRWLSRDLAIGLTIFFIGLCKKSLLADGIAPYANSVFNAATDNDSPELFLAWAGVLAYTFQLYFDFSGYSDMAIGAARCFGIVFPMNFNSPYKSTSIIEFWRRWHMTLSRFLRDYLYISLGGNRQGPGRRYTNLMLTMLLGGLWHGASWTFVAWGGLHGIYLIVNHAWIAVAARSSLARGLRLSRFGQVLGWLVTFLVVIVAWTVFRAPTFDTAAIILRGMVGWHGAILPFNFRSILQPIEPLLTSIGIVFGNGSATNFVKAWVWIVVLSVIALILPNTQQVMSLFNPVLEVVEPAHHKPRLIWTPSAGWAVAIGIAAFFGVISVTRVSEFLYWQF